MIDTGRTLTVTPLQRIQMLNILPQEAGSLEESIHINRLRDEINFSDRQLDRMNMDPQTGSFDPEKLAQFEDLTIELSEGQTKVLAAALVRMEEEGQVPTNDAFVDLAIELEDKIKEFRDNL